MPENSFLVAPFGVVPSAASTTDWNWCTTQKRGVRRHRAVSPVLRADTATIAAHGFSQKVEYFDTSRLINARRPPLGDL